MYKRRKRDIKVWYANKQESTQSGYLDALFKKPTTEHKLLEESAVNTLAKYFASKHVGHNLFKSPSGCIYRKVNRK